MAETKFFKLFYLMVLYSISLKTVKNAEVEFVVFDVPKYYTPFDDDIYITGSFNNWSPNHTDYKLQRLTHNQFKINLNLKSGLYEYKFTRGSWKTLETEENGAYLRSRKLKINSNEKQTISIKIFNWDDMKGNHTASGNIFYISRFPYPQFNKTKQIWIYLPSDYFYTNRSYSVLYISDGHFLFDDFFVPFDDDDEQQYDEIVEKFLANGKETSILVGLGTRAPDRYFELSPYPNFSGLWENEGGKGDLYLDFLINNVKPFVDLHFRTKPERQHTGILGASLGGLAAFYAGIKYESVFSKLGVFSPGFLWNDTIYKFAEENSLKYNDTKIYFLVGSKERFEELNFDMVGDTIKMVDIFISKGFEKNIRFKVSTDGEHNGWFWKREFPTAYSYLFHEL